MVQNESLVFDPCICEACYDIHQIILNDIHKALNVTSMAVDVFSDIVINIAPDITIRLDNTTLTLYKSHKQCSIASQLVKRIDLSLYDKDMLHDLVNIND